MCVLAYICTCNETLECILFLLYYVLPVSTPVRAVFSPVCSDSHQVSWWMVGGEDWRQNWSFPGQFCEGVCIHTYSMYILYVLYVHTVHTVCVYCTYVHTCGWVCTPLWVVDLFSLLCTLVQQYVCIYMYICMQMYEHYRWHTYIRMYMLDSNSVVRLMKKSALSIITNQHWK